MFFAVLTFETECRCVFIFQIAHPFSLQIRIVPPKKKRFTKSRGYSESAHSWKRRLGDNLYAAPEGNMIFDRFSRLFGRGVVPGGILIGSIADPDVVVACDALPRTGGVGLA